MTDDPDDDDGPLTQADLDEAKARWADPSHQPDITELFARPVTGNGVQGDGLLGEDTSDADAAGS